MNSMLFYTYIGDNLLEAKSQNYLFNRFGKLNPHFSKP